MLHGSMSPSSKHFKLLFLLSPLIIFPEFYNNFIFEESDLKLSYLIFHVFTTVGVLVAVVRAVKPYSVSGDIYILEERAASIFRLIVSILNLQSRYVHWFQRKGSLRYTAEE